MKTREELNKIKEETEPLNEKPAELNDEELELVNGGLVPDCRPPQSDELF